MTTWIIPDEIQGKKPGSDCPHCARGQLLPIIAVDSGGGGAIGGGPSSWTRQTIVRLACDACSSSFEVAKEFREVDLQKYLENQLGRFKNPDTKPVSCQSCGHKLSEGARTEDYSFGRRGEVVTVARYLFCGVCYKVYWHEKVEPKPRQPKLL